MSFNSLYDKIDKQWVEGAIMQNNIGDKNKDARLISLKENLSTDQNVSFALIFGSYAGTKQERARDLDVAVYFMVPPQGMDLLDLINRLSDLTGKEVDLVVLNSASAFLRHQVMKQGVLLIMKDRNVYRRFREKTISDYDEYKYVSGMNVYD